MSMQTAPCTKCRSNIPVDADRCLECGYEPSSKGLLAEGIVTLVLLPILLFSAMMVILIPILAFGSTLEATSAVVGLLLFGGITLGIGKLFYTIYKQRQAKATA